MGFEEFLETKAILVPADCVVAVEQATTISALQIFCAGNCAVIIQIAL